jgi:hypothetical protein
LRTISSRQTFFAKFVVSAIWIIGFGCGTLALWVISSTPTREEGSPPTEMKWLFLFAWLLGIATFSYIGFRVKRVRIDDEHLLISNYVREIRIPFRDLEEVTENRWWNHHPVTLHLRSESVFGTKIVFMPKMRLLGFWTSHPIVKELRQLAVAARLGPAAASIEALRSRQPVSWPRRIAVIVCVVAALGLGVMVVVEILLRTSEPYRQAVVSACQDEQVRARLGVPIRTGWFTGGSINWAGPASHARLRIPLHGPRGRGSLFGEADKASGEWRFRKLSFSRDGDSSPIALQGEIGSTTVAGPCK